MELVPIEPEQELVEVKTKKVKSKNSPLSFDSRGLRNGIEYSFNEDGFVDWSKLIEQQYFVPNKEYFKKFNRPIPNSAEGLVDKEKLALLMGYKKVAAIRGYSSVRYIPFGYSQEEIVVSCEITWTPNFETGMLPVTYSSIGNANFRNVSEEFCKYLGAMAENRAFIKAVRGFLNIPIYGKDEMPPEEDEKQKSSLPLGVSPTSPHAVLINKMSNAGADLEKAKKYWIKCGLDADLVGSWKEIADIPAKDVITILGFSGKK